MIPQYEAQDLFDAVSAQRDGAMNGLAQARAEIATKDRRIAELEAKLAEASKPAASSIDD